MYKSLLLKLKCCFPLRVKFSLSLLLVTIMESEVSSFSLFHPNKEARGSTPFRHQLSAALNLGIR